MRRARLTVPVTRDQSGEEIPKIVRTLIGSGFILDRVVDQGSYVVFTVRRWDEFGVSCRYLIAYSKGSPFSLNDIATLEGAAVHEQAHLVIVGATKGIAKDNAAIITRDAFMARLGGVIPSYLALETRYPEELRLLGHNKKPNGLVGVANELFEVYVHAGLEFLFQDRVLRYGQDRRFEVVPDGLVFGRKSFLLLYDCKAAGDGYAITTESIRQFADYVQGFHSHYEHYVGRLYAFVVISGDFQEESRLIDRSAELRSACDVPLACLKAETLGKIISVLANRPALRRAINWRTVFSRALVAMPAFEKQVSTIGKDGVIAQLDKKVDN